MNSAPKRKASATNRAARRPIEELISIMARLRSPTGCPWDREQTHLTLRFHAVEEVYELMEAIEAGDDEAMVEELGDLLLQVIFHCQMARERKAFDFDAVCRGISGKLIRRHPHVFGDSQARDVDAVWAQWEKIKQAEKKGSRHERRSALDGVPRGLPSLLRAEKLLKKAGKAGLSAPASAPLRSKQSRKAMSDQLIALVQAALKNNWSVEELLREKINQLETRWRREETRRAAEKR